ncbi:cell division protein FtsL [Ureibacillus sp. FSL K6-8385]|uniref:Cell division protein FtsL n=1 Tax=Ureibacillus terrenus TaxID=118246 RepID=A0A540V467_9BACL|nr:cell division protein FtsL [Ureibacillus terrenus]MED3660310.1 cell division protein FtsL [Ureibacillus terrenus]MED3762466.1 cell division protein FtsL [Ureibacillus terrenus]TQE91537.1 cell division protein FtsL [Ureibacillus terrenus]
MAVRVKQQFSYHQLEAPNQQPSIQSNTKKHPKKQRNIITAKEKFLYILFVVIIATLSVLFLHKQSAIQQTTIEIQKIEKEIAEIKKQNVDLKVQVNELSTYERIWEKANSLGLTLNEDNVKVVPGE